MTRRSDPVRISSPDGVGWRTDVRVGDVDLGRYVRHIDISLDAEGMNTATLEIAGLEVPEVLAQPTYLIRVPSAMTHDTARQIADAWIGQVGGRVLVMPEDVHIEYFDGPDAGTPIYDTLAAEYALADGVVA